MKPAARLTSIPPYPFARWNQEVRRVQQEGRDVIRLDMGNPDLPPPQSVIDALCRSAQCLDHHGYPGYRGIAALREAIANYYARRFDVTLDPGSEVVPLLGSKEGIINMSLSFLDEGDVALIPDPGYPPYTRGALLAGASIHRVPLRHEDGFLPDLDAIPLDVARCASLLWLNYPNNPTGAIADLDFFARAVHFARAHDILLCHDAPYSDVTYGDYTAPSILQVPGAKEVVVEFNSLSKMFNMAGWRMGMAVGNAPALALLARLKSNIDSGIFLPLQEAAVRALGVKREWIAARNEIYRQRLERVIAALRAFGLAAAPPRATLYVWTRVPEGWGAEEFALALLEKTGVAVAPGSFFGPGGEGYVRLSVTTVDERIEQACQRLRNTSLSRWDK